MEVLLIGIFLALLLLLIFKGNKNTIEDNHITRAKIESGYNQLAQYLLEIDGGLKEFNKLFKAYKKELKVLVTIVDELSTSMNVKTNKEKEKLYTDIVKNINKFSKVKPKLTIVTNKKEQKNDKTT